MSWFQLDPESVVQRVRATGRPVKIPGLGTSLGRGVLGFTLLSIAGFAPWAVTGRWFYQRIGEVGLYLVCAAMFIGLSGPLLHRLILGPGSLARFYKLFAAAFTAYAILWIAGWFAFRGHTGSLAGLLAGTAAMGWMLACAFDTKRDAVKIIAALFVLNSAGYFIGGWVEGAVMGAPPLPFFGEPLTKKSQATLAMLLWGVCYGVGFGGGLGLAFHLCQAKTRAALSAGREGPATTSAPG